MCYYFTRPLRFLMSILRQLPVRVLLAGSTMTFASMPVLAQVAGGPSITASLVTSGTGEAKVTPDRAAVMVNVQTRGATAAAAASDNARRTTAVLEALGKLGLPKAQLSTEGY